MGMTTVTLLAPANTTPWTNVMKRPEITLYYVGATGPFDVLCEWDDDPTFGNANGRRIQVSQNGEIPTSQSLTLNPGADLGLLTAGTVWYLRVTVTDTNDAGSLSDSHSITLFDPDDEDRFLYADLAVSWGFGPTDDPPERQIVANDATAGTFTLTLDGQTTSSLQWNDTPANVETALENLSNVTDVEVRSLPSAGNGWEVIFLDATPDPIPLMTATDTLTGGSTTITSLVDDSDAWGTTEGGTAEPDGNTQDFNRYLYLGTGLKWGFDPIDVPAGGWGDAIGGAPGDGVAQDFNRYLYTQTNITNDRPCPFIFNVSPTTVKTGETITIDGQGFNASEDVDLSGGVVADSMGGASSGLANLIDGNTGTEYNTNDPWLAGDWVRVDLGAANAQEVESFTLTPNPSFDWPVDWRLEGSNNASTWDFMGNFGMSSGSPVTFTVDQQYRAVYRYYRIVANANNPSRMRLREWEMVAAAQMSTEVRLYESPSHSAPFVVLTQISESYDQPDDQIVAQIPGGASSGFVGIYHTSDPPDCGSNFKALTVQAVDPDRQAGWWVEVWNLRNDTPIVRPLPFVYAADFEAIVSDIGRGSITIPADHPDLADIIDRDASPPVQTLIKVYLHSRYAYSFVPIDKSDPWTEDGAARVRIYGPGQESILRWGRALWKDYPAQPSSARTWLYGSSDNAYPVGSMEPANQITNGGAEDAVVQPWAPVGTATLFAGTSEPRTGSYSLEITPAAQNDGASIELSVKNGWREYVDVYVKDPIAAGDDITVDVLDSASSVVATSTIAPTTASWQLVTLTYVPAEDATHTLRIRYTDATGTPHLIRVDDVAAYGQPNFGDGFALARATASITRDQVAEGLHALSVSCNAGGDATFNGYVDTFAVEPNRDYSATFAVQGVAGKVARIGLRLGGVLDQTDVTLTGVGTWDVVTLSGTAGPDEDTGRYAISSLNSTAEIIYVDAVAVTPGAAAATVGAVVVDVHTAMAARGTLDFVQLGFDATVDSNGDAWPETLAIEVQPKWTLAELLDKIVGLGYQYQFAPTNYAAGSDTGWSLDLYAPNTFGSDWSLTPDGPAILPASGIESADPSAAPPLSTVVFAEGADGVWSTVSSAAAVIAALERREDFLNNRAAANSTSLFRSASHRLDVATNRGASHTIGIVGSDADPLPYFDFLPGDRLRVHLPKDDRDLVPDGVYQIAAVAAVLGPPTQVRFAVDLGLYRLTKDRASALLLNRLVERQETENYLPGTGSVRETGS